MFRAQIRKTINNHITHSLILILILSLKTITIYINKVKMGNWCCIQREKMDMLQKQDERVVIEENRSAVKSTERRQQQKEELTHSTNLDANSVSVSMSMQQTCEKTDDKNFVNKNNATLLGPGEVDDVEAIQSPNKQMHGEKLQGKPFRRNGFIIRMHHEMNKTENLHDNQVGKDIH